METSTARNKLEARRIESWLRSQISDLGISRIAEVAGRNKSTVSRWQGGTEHVAAAGNPDF